MRFYAFWLTLVSALRTAFSLQRLIASPKIYTSELSGSNPRTKISLCRDETDNFLLETAILGKAKYLVSGDNDLVDDKKLKAEMLKRGVVLVGVAEFVAILEEGGWR
jgi:predicted nucleic acid-binding protein